MLYQNYGKKTRKNHTKNKVENQEIFYKNQCGKTRKNERKNTKNYPIFKAKKLFFHL